MRIRDLKREELSVWPPLPSSSFGRGGTFSTFAEANQSILTGVRRTKNGLWLTVQFRWARPRRVVDLGCAAFR